MRLRLLLLLYGFLAKCSIVHDFLPAGIEAVRGRGGQEGGEDAAEEADQGSGCQVRREQIYVTTYESTLITYRIDKTSRGVSSYRIGHPVG